MILWNIENEKIISQFVGTIKCYDQSGEVSKNDQSCHICSIWDSVYIYYFYTIIKLPKTVLEIGFNVFCFLFSGYNNIESVAYADRGTSYRVRQKFWIPFKLTFLTECALVNKWKFNFRKSRKVVAGIRTSNTRWLCTLWTIKALTWPWCEIN